MPRLCVIEGDGIGREVVPAAVSILQALIPDLELVYAQAGWEYFLQHSTSVPEETLEAVRSCGAGLFGAVSSPAHKVPGYRSAITTLRQSLDLYANIRPVRSLPSVSPRPDVDLIIVRENTQGLYAGRERFNGEQAIAERLITRSVSYRIGQRAVELALRLGRQRLTIVHKANILPLTDGLFRDSVREAADSLLAGDRRLALDELLVDTAALRLISQPQSLDVLVTTNLFGDILSDEAAYWCGGIGLAPSLNWGDAIAIAEPVHGSAPDIAGKGIANPIAAILSAALIVRFMWEMPALAVRIESAIEAALREEIPIQDGCVLAGTTTASITQAVLRRLS